MSSADLTIQQLGPLGDGIHFGPRGRVFVDRALPGDRVKAKIRRDDRGQVRAEVLALIKPSPMRQEAPCPHYDTCGNCTLQHLNEKFYREWKVNAVREALRAEKVSPRRWEPTLFVPERTRRRATFSAQLQRGKIVLGYYRRRSRQISSIQECRISQPQLLKLHEKLLGALPQLLVEGPPTDFFIQMLGNEAELVITGPIGKSGLPDGRVRGAMSRLVGPFSRIGWRAHEEAPVEFLTPDKPLLAQFGDLQVALPPAAFLQPTAEGEAALVAAVEKALPGTGLVADLFAGCGTFSGPLLKRHKVNSFELALPAVKALTRAARKHSLRTFRRDLFKNPLRRQELGEYDFVVMDPPRAGAEAQAHQLAGSRVKVVVSVSCHPASFARDAKILVRGGYQLDSLQIVDQFVWSHHVELVGVFSRPPATKASPSRQSAQKGN